MKKFKIFNRTAILLIVLNLFSFKTNKLFAQSGEIPGILRSEAYTDNPKPISDCSDIGLCVSILNETDNPYRTFNGAKIQIIINLNDYRIIDPTPFVNTGQVDPVFGHAIFETTQNNIMSLNDPNFSGPDDGYYRFCMTVRKIPNGFHKTGFKVKIILSTGETIEYGSGFINFSTLYESIGVDQSSTTYLSQIAVATNPSLADGELLTRDIACTGDHGNPESQTFILHGTLIVDIPYCFMGNIYMDDGAIIKIDDGVICNIGFGTFDNQKTIIDPCGKMWKSITVGEYSTLNITHTFINHGLYGTELLSNATANINNSTYNNNYVGIFNSASSNNIVNVTDSKFLFEGSLKSNCWNCAGLRPHNRTYAGILLSESLLNVTSSEFKNLINGVRVFNTNTEVSSSTFSEIWDYGTNNNILGSAFSLNGKGVHSSGEIPQNLKVTNSTFTGGNWGIYTKGVNANLKNNTMPYILTGMQLDHSPGRSFDIKHNTISAVNRGINFSWTGDVSSIVVNDQNTINLLDKNSVGIDIVETHGNTKFIYQNNISIGNGYKGINHENSESSMIYNNSIFANGTHAFPNVGISITGGRNNLTACNLLSSSMVCNNQGLFVSESANNVDIGNQAGGWLYDYQFVGTSLGTTFATNKMGNANHGLIMGFPQGGFGARIGVQEHMGNRWTGIHAKGAKHYGPPNDLVHSKFIVNAQDPNNPDVKPNNLAEVVGDGWFTDLPGNAANWTCNLGIGSGNSNPFPRVFPRSDDYFIANNNFDSEYDWGSRIWTDRRQLYRQILETEDGVTIPLTFNNFFNTQTNTSVGQFELIEKRIRNTYLNGKSINDQLQANLVGIESLSTNIVNITDQMKNLSNPTEQATLQLQLNDLKTQRNVILDNQATLNNQWLTVIQTNLNQLLLENNSIITTEVYEQNQKLVNQLMLQKMISNDWSLSESERIQIDQIANQCPYFGGNAVYRARALAALYGIDRYNDDEICNESLSSRNKINKNNSIDKVSIYPNPVSNLITFSFPNKSNNVISIEILNMEGKILSQINTNLHQEELTFSTNNLPSGIYIAKINLTDGINLNAKFIKN